MITGGSRILGIDPGTKWIGLAIADWEVKIATAFEIIEYKGQAKFMDRLKEIVEGENISLIVLGLPLNMDGTEGKKALEARKLAELMNKNLSVEIELIDERLTTVQAIKELHQMDEKVGKNRRKLNMMAARIILQDYLDSLRDS